jgi:uncharacterized protein YraI
MMKKLLMTTALVLLGTAAYAEDLKFTVPNDVGGGHMNMRTGPGVDHALVGEIPAGQDVTATRCVKRDDHVRGADWCYVTYNGKHGWVSEAGLIPFEDKKADAENPPQVEQREEPEALRFTIPDNVSQGYMNIRTGPGSKHQITGTIPAGQTVTASKCVQRDDGISGPDWCYVNWNGKQGWVSEQGLGPVEARHNIESDDPPAGEDQPPADQHPVQTPVSKELPACDSEQVQETLQHVSRALKILETTNLASKDPSEKRWCRSQLITSDNKWADVVFHIMWTSAAEGRFFLQLEAAKASYR